MILSAAAIEVTAASTLAFKTAKQFIAGHTFLVQITDGLGGNIACRTCRSVRAQNIVGVHIANCVTAGPKQCRAGTRNNKTYFNSHTVNKVNCLSLLSKVDKSL